MSTHFTSTKEDYMNNFKSKSKTILEVLSRDHVDAHISVPVNQQEEKQQYDHHNIILEQQPPIEPRRSGRVIKLPAQYMLVGDTCTFISDGQVHDPTI